MRTPRTLSTLLAAALAASALAMAPALSTDETGETPPEDGTEVDEYEPCAAFEGATVITPEEGFDEQITTPAGALNTGSEFDVGEVTELGYFQLDLAGFEVGARGRLSMTLSWDTPGGLGDYDLIIDGSNEYSVDAPEFHTRTLGHCGLVDLTVDVFIGTPLDTVTFEVDVTPLAPIG